MTTEILDESMEVVWPGNFLYFSSDSTPANSCHISHVAGRYEYITWPYGYIAGNVAQPLLLESVAHPNMVGKTKCLPNK